MQVWYERFGYAINTKIINILKLLTGIRDLSANYDLVKIYNNFEVSKLEDLIINNAKLSFK